MIHFKSRSTAYLGAIFILSLFFTHCPREKIDYKSPNVVKGKKYCQKNYRTIQAVNMSTQDVWLGMAGGTLKCSKDSDCDSNKCDKTAKVCACSKSASCGKYMSCGSNPKYCYWNTPKGSGSRLKKLGGTAILCIPNSKKYVQWSGNLFARTGCDGNGRNCATGNCSNKANKPCKTGVGGTPPATLAEFTLNNKKISDKARDFYDISIINGVNIAMEMAPVSGTYDTSYNASAYFCGVPGSRSKQSNSSGNLSACSWKITPPGQKIELLHVKPVSYTGKTCPGRTQPNSLGYCPCSKSTDCGDNVCGTAQNASSAILTAVCGTKAGWWTADQICGIIGASSSYGSIKCDKNSLFDLLQCTGTNGASCYSKDATTKCCGCGTYTATKGQAKGKKKKKDSAWPATIAPGFGGKGSTNGCYKNNKKWQKHAKPYLAYLKKACPTAYVYPFDDATSTFTCKGKSGSKKFPTGPNYKITISDI